MNDEPIGKLIAYAQTLKVVETSGFEIAAFLALIALSIWIAVKMYRGH